jgi:hypothetical protein
MQDKGTVVGSADMGDYIVFKSINFGNGMAEVQMATAVDAAHANQRIELRLDSPTGTLIGTYQPQSSGTWTTFINGSAPLNASTTGTHNLYFVMNATAQDQAGVADIDWIKLLPISAPTLLLNTTSKIIEPLNAKLYRLNGQHTINSVH